MPLPRPCLVVHTGAAGVRPRVLGDHRGAAGAGTGRQCTRLALRATQAALLAAKGTGFVAPHPAQRWARQALFFLVWSCPRPVAEGVLGDLSDGG